MSWKNYKFRETDDGRYLIELKGLIKFKALREINTESKYRILEVDFKKYHEDLVEKEKI